MRPAHLCLVWPPGRGAPPPRVHAQAPLLRSGLANPPPLWRIVGKARAGAGTGDHESNVWFGQPGHEVSRSNTYGSSSLQGAIAR